MIGTEAEMSDKTNSSSDNRRQQRRRRRRRRRSQRGGQLDLEIDRIPQQLRDLDQWLIARRSPANSQRDKVPLWPRSTDAPDARLSFEQAFDGIESPTSVDIATELRSDEHSLLGFVFTNEDDFVFIDWDDVYDPETGQLSKLVADDIRELGGYVELSTSRTGIHQIGTIDTTTATKLAESGFKGSIPSDPIGSLDERPHLDIYYSGQYGALTGWTVPALSATNCESGSDSGSDSDSDSWSESQFNSICDMSSTLLDTVGTYLCSDSRSQSESESESESTQTTYSSSALTDVTSRKARQRRGRKHIDGEWIETDSPTPEQVWATGLIHGDDDFQQLWMDDDLRYLSRSEADCAFVSKLWFFCDNREIIDDCFRTSNRMREKWTRDSYRETTIEYASDNPDRYQGGYLTPSGDDPLP